MLTDPIADMLTRIRNASMVGKKQVLVPYSKIKFEIAKILVKEKYLASAEIHEDGAWKELLIGLKYNDKQPVISSIQRVSKGGRRIYAKKDELPRVLNNMGLAIVTTSAGLLTNKEAKKKGIGGEVICEVY